mgnify:CR=1 FL=1
MEMFHLFTQEKLLKVLKSPREVFLVPQFSKRALKVLYFDRFKIMILLGIVFIAFLLVAISFVLRWGVEAHV